MIKFLINTLTKMGAKKQTAWYRMLISLSTAFFIFILIPIFYIYMGNYITTPTSLGSTWVNIIAVLLVCLSSLLIIWTLVLQYKAKGSGSHIAPTQKLITSGPYKFSRHPMLVAAVLFYFGTGTLLSSVFIGLYGAFVTTVLAYFFVKHIEEPVLIARFGNQYKQYQKKVPIIPFLF